MQDCGTKLTLFVQLLLTQCGQSIPESGQSVVDYLINMGKEVGPPYDMAVLRRIVVFVKPELAQQIYEFAIERLLDDVEADNAKLEVKC